MKMSSSSAEKCSGTVLEYPCYPFALAGIKSPSFSASVYTYSYSSSSLPESDSYCSSTKSADWYGGLPLAYFVEWSPYAF